MSRSGSVIRSIVSMAALYTLAAPCALAADDPVETTGSRLGSDAPTRTVIPVNQDSPISRVRRLLADDRNEEAIELAEAYVTSLNNSYTVGANNIQQRYDALNVLCTALTKDGRLDEAFGRCSEAIELIPSRWAAVNNRGTVQYAQGNFVSALEDYRHARDLVKDKDNRLLVEHNIQLTRDRLEEGRGDP